MEYGYDQSLTIYPEASDGADECQFTTSPGHSKMMVVSVLIL
jgi:hypothetical protein